MINFRAEIYRRQGDVTMAIVNYTQAIKLKPTDHNAYYQRAEMYEMVSVCFPRHDFNLFHFFFSYDINI